MQRLEEAGISTSQAKAEAEALREALAEMVEMKELATMKDLAILEGSFETAIEKAKADIVKWVAGLLIAQVGLVVALVKLL